MRYSLPLTYNVVRVVDRVKPGNTSTVGNMGTPGNSKIIHLQCCPLVFVWHELSAVNCQKMKSARNQHILHDKKLCFLNNYVKTYGGNRIPSMEV